MRLAADAQEINDSLYPFNRLADYTDTLEDIGEAELERYRQAGYLAIRHALGAEEIREAGEAILDIVLLRSRLSRESFKQHYLNLSASDAEPGEGFKKTNHLEAPAERVKTPYVQLTKSDNELATPEERELAARKVADFVGVEPRLHAIAYHPAILAVVERIFGEKPKLVQDMALLKPPFGGGEKPWHQDMAYRGLDFDKPVVGVWIALDEAAVDNGCMHVIPRSHMDGGTPHYAVRDWQICDEKVNVRQDVVVPLPPGGLMFFHGMLHHGTPNNLSDRRRKALQFHYAPESAGQMTPQEYKRMFTNEISGATC